MQSLDGKIAIVTGAARGLGAACATALAQQGASVVLTDLLIEQGEATAAALRKAGHQAEFVQHDVASEASWDNVIATALKQFGRVDIVVNNAGINLAKTIEDVTLDEFRRVLEINLLGCFLGTQRAIRQMKTSGGGAIVNIASNSTRDVIPLTTAYSSSKAAVANLSKVAAMHCAAARYNIRVNSVHPGPTETDMLISDPSVPLALIASLVPIGRLGQPREIGEVVAFLASESASFVTGAEIFVDGGMSVNMTPGAGQPTS